MEEDLSCNTSGHHFFLGVCTSFNAINDKLTLPYSTIGSSIYAPAFPAIQQAWGVSTTVALLPLTTYVLALAFGPIIAAPMSETYGRHIVYLLSVPIAILFTIGTGFSQNIWTLCILRFFSGMAFSPALAIGAGTIADMTKNEHRTIPSTFYVLSPFLGPALGSVLFSSPLSLST